jgi:eukaryotic-like serine/threonine-protein kinase
MSTPTEVAGRYRLDGRLGAGGMSTVFRATDTVLERSVALKLLAEHLAEDEAFVARFRREALAAARLQHPNIVQVFDSGEDPESHRHFIVMELVDGPSCADIVRDSKLLEIEDTVRYVVDACHGLDYAHKAGVVHRDVKPGNLLVASGTDSVKLADFGIAKAAEQTRITQVGSVLGTAAYLSPEQARGEEAGPPSDVYSLGVCAYQFLAGRLPHEYGSLTELALKQQNDTVEPIAVHRPEVPAALDDAIRICLAREPDARYHSALELAQALEAGFYDQPTDATQRLAPVALGDPDDATRALPQDTAATRVDIGTAATAGAPAAPVRTDRAAGRRAAPRRRGRRLFGGMLVLLAILLAAGAVALAVLFSGDGTNTVGPVDKGDVQQQIDGVREFLREQEQR